MPEADLRRVILRRLNILTVVIVAFGLALGGTAGWVYVRSNQSTVALCALRTDLDKRILSSQAFLIDHPQGVAGIPAPVIRTQIANSQRTRHALRNLSC